MSTASSLRTYHRIAELRRQLAQLRAEGKSVGFVPTMGALHEGHLSLVDRARATSDIVVMSVFVNPLQFAPGEDYRRYPRDIRADTEMAEERGVDLLFVPDVAEMYNGDRQVTVTAGPIGDAWEGESRPGHFDGVLTVVAKLFNIVQPDRAIFGQKDLQQLAVVRAMTRELRYPIEIIVGPTVRDDDGLALSSRNRYLKPADRQAALALPRALQTLRERFASGEIRPAKLEAAGKKVIDDTEGVSLDYLAVVDAEAFQRVGVASHGCAAIAAARVGGTRLIDNLLF